LYYHGTSFENVQQMLHCGMINSVPEKQVWPDYSGYHIYFFTDDIKDDAKELAAQQSSFALWAFSHTQRAIIEIDPSKLDSELISKDPHDNDAVRYSAPIPVHAINKVHVEIMYPQKTTSWWEYIAIVMFLKLYPLNSSFFQVNESMRKEYLMTSDVQFIELIDHAYWSKGSKIADRLEDLGDELMDLERFHALTVDQLLSDISSQLLYV